MTSFQRVQFGNGQKVNFTSEKTTTNTTLPGNKSQHHTDKSC